MNEEKPKTTSMGVMFLVFVLCILFAPWALLLIVPWMAIKAYHRAMNR